MPLKILGPGEGFLVALTPPGNIAAELNEYRSRLFQALGAPGAFPFPCAAPLSWVSAPPGYEALASLADRAPRSYLRLASEKGFLFLAPPSEAAAPYPGSVESPSPGPVPCGMGFLLARFEDDRTVRSILSSLPPPPALAFRTFQASVLRLRWAQPGGEGLHWETLGSIRYPRRILTAP